MNLTTQPTRQYYFMDYTRLINQAKKVKAFLDKNHHHYAHFHYRQFSKCIRVRLYQQPKTYKDDNGKLKFFRASLINPEAKETLNKCLLLLQQLGFVRHYEFEPAPKQDSYIITIELTTLQTDFDQALKQSEYFPVEGVKQQLTTTLRQTIAEQYHIDYQNILASSKAQNYQQTVSALLESLPDLWHQSYNAMINGPSFVQHIKRDFSFMFDFQSQVLPSDHHTKGNEYQAEDRVVVFYGQSIQSEVKRDASRMAGYMRNVFNWTDKDTDKGHFIGHSLGGGIDENLFPQKRQINRGQSARGKIYRAMETYCASHPGTFCFSRPIYGDFSCRPFILEYGVLKQDGILWVEQFDNV